MISYLLLMDSCTLYVMALSCLYDDILITFFLFFLEDHL